MKKLWFMLAMCICVWASCSDGGSEDPANPTPKPEEVVTPEITIGSDILTNGLAFDAKQGEKSVSFSTNVDWTLSVASTSGGSTWCKASATSGSKGSANVKFTVEEHTDYDDRSVSVTIKAGTASKTFTITQKCADALLITTDKYEVAQDGATIEVEVKANIDYQVAVSETAKSWISEVQSKSRALTTRKHSFTIATNEDTEKREGEITFKSGDKVETVKVYQAGGPIVLLTKDEYSVSDLGETISVDLKSNVEFGVKMPEVDWITEESASRAMSSHTLKYIISPNEDYDSRSAEIVFYDKNSNVTDTLKVIQAQKDAIVISQKNYEVQAEGETIEVKLSANVEFDVTMPEVDWVSQVSSRALTEHTLYFKVTKNEAEEDRKTEITLTNKNSGLEEKIVINQQGTLPKADFTINVTEPGTLSTYIASERLGTLTSIKIVGELNDDDLHTISKMSSLKILDLSEAEIIGGIIQANEESSPIPGSVQYFYSPRNIIELKGYCRDYGNGYRNCVSVFGTDCFEDPDRVLYYSSCFLKYVDLPSSLQTIGELSFMNSDIKKIIIPENVVSIEREAFLYNHDLENFVLKSSKLDRIEAYAFYHCSLLNIDLSKGVRKIGEGAFIPFSNGDNNYPNEIKLPSNIETIEESAFRGYINSISCNSEIKIHIDNLDNWCNVKLENFNSNPLHTTKNTKLYHNNKLVTSLTIENVSKINNYIFINCHSLEKVTIGGKVESIGEYSFNKCKNITELKVGNNVKTIKSGAFSKCSKLEKITLGTSVKEISNNTFSDTAPTEVYCYATTPPSISSSNNFENINKETAKLYVPKGTYSAYYLSNWGSIFTNIIEMEE